MTTLPRISATIALALAASACNDSSSSPPPAYPQNGAAPYGYGQPAPYGQVPQPYGQPGYPQPAYTAAPAPYAAPTAAPGYSAPSVPTAVPSVAGAQDPITNTDVNWLRQHAASLMVELVSALPDVAKQRVQGIPLDVDDTPGEVNAYAACNGSKAVMVITDGLLDIAAHLSQARANDDVFGTRKVTDYINFIAQNQKPNGPVIQPPRGFFDPSQQADGRRVARQHDVLDEVIGFVLGHELAHHHLGHLPCTGGSGFLGTGELLRGLSQNVPVFNQPNEIAADTAGTDTILTAGARRPGYHLNEGGGLLMMQFFEASDQLSPEDILFGFERDHPPPAIRIPVIQQTANFWRVTGGTWVPLPRL
ncbi:MAG TPA: M48 family metalloprotease [Polyangiaceae bacterium]|jgi:hypothetical protein|nr:M48 family metalloprotease [Polyangiaceae bacterium]